MASLDRLLDFLGTCAAGVVVLSSTGAVAMPAWLVGSAAVIAWASGKASNPGVPFAGKKAPAPSPSVAP